MMRDEDLHGASREDRFERLVRRFRSFWSRFKARRQSVRRAGADAEMSGYFDSSYLGQGVADVERPGYVEGEAVSSQESTLDKIAPVFVLAGVLYVGYRVVKAKKKG